MNALNGLAEAWWGWMWPMFWQVSLLIAVVAIIDRLMEKKVWPQVRYALWLLIFVKLVLPPTLSSPVSLFGHLHRPESAETVSVTTRSPLEFTETTGSPAVVPHEPAVTAVSLPGSVEPEPPVPAPRPGDPLSWQVYAMAVWFLGLVFLAAWAGSRYRKLRREFMGESPFLNESEDVRRVLHTVAETLGLRRAPRLTFSARVGSPAVFGLFRPVLVMPERFARDREAAANDELRYVLMHELTHIRRGDLLVHALTMVLQIVYWFHPLLWFASRRLRNVRELCCDATVAGILREETPGYREALLRTAERLLGSKERFGIGLLGLVERPGGLVARLGWLEKKVWRHRQLRFGVVIGVVAAMCILILPMAARPVSEGGEGAMPPEGVPSPAEDSIGRIEIELLPDSPRSRRHEKVVLERRGDEYVALRGNREVAVLPAADVESFWKKFSELEKVEWDHACHPGMRRKLTEHALTPEEAESLIGRIEEEGLRTGGLPDEDRELLHREFREGIEYVMLGEAVKDGNWGEESLRITVSRAGIGSGTLSAHFFGSPGSWLVPRFRFYEPSRGTWEFPNDAAAAELVGGFLARLGRKFDLAALDPEQWRKTILSVDTAPLVERTRKYSEVYAKIRATPAVEAYFADFEPVEFLYSGFGGSTRSQRGQPVEYQYNLYLESRAQPGIQVWIEPKTTDHEVFYGVPPAAEVVELCRRAGELEFVRSFLRTDDARLLLYLTEGRIDTKEMCSFRNGRGFELSAYLWTGPLGFEAWVMRFEEPPTFLDLADIPEEEYFKEPLRDATVVAAILEIERDGRVKFVKSRGLSPNAKTKPDEEGKASPDETKTSSAEGKAASEENGDSRDMAREGEAGIPAARTAADLPMTPEQRKYWEGLFWWAGLEGAMSSIVVPGETRQFAWIPHPVYHLDQLELGGRRISLWVEPETLRPILWMEERHGHFGAKPVRTPDEVRTRMRDLGKRFLPEGDTRDMVRGPTFLPEMGTWFARWQWTETKPVFMEVDDGFVFSRTNGKGVWMEVDDENLFLRTYANLDAMNVVIDASLAVSIATQAERATTIRRRMEREKSESVPSGDDGARKPPKIKVALREEPTLMVVSYRPDYLETRHLRWKPDPQRERRLAWNVKMKIWNAEDECEGAGVRDLCVDVMTGEVINGGEPEMIIMPHHCLERPDETTSATPEVAEVVRATRRRTLQDIGRRADALRTWDTVLEAAGLPGAMREFPHPGEPESFAPVPFPVYHVDHAMVRGREISIWIIPETGDIIQWIEYKRYENRAEATRSEKEVEARIEELAGKLLPEERVLVRGPEYIERDRSWLAAWNPTEHGIPFEVGGYGIRVADEDLSLRSFSKIHFAHVPADMSAEIDSEDAGRIAAESMIDLKKRTIRKSRGSVDVDEQGLHEKPLPEVKAQVCLEPELRIVPYDPGYFALEQSEDARRPDAEMRLAWEVKMNVLVDAGDGSWDVYGDKLWIDASSGEVVGGDHLLCVTKYQPKEDGEAIPKDIGCWW